ncbi:MAG: signal peptidase II [Thermoleophilia bacterium]
MSRVRVQASVLAVAIAAVDQLAGWAVRRDAAHLPWTLGRELAIRLTHNTGISFSRLSGGGDWLRVLIALVCVALALAIWRAPARFAVPLAFVLGGAAGNLIDRLRFGYVVDYVAVGPWPTFNVGDVAIAVGAVLVVFVVLFPAAGGHAERQP